MPQEDVLINFEVDYSQLTAAQEQLAKAGKIDNKGFQDIQKAIDTTATDTKGLIKQFKDVATASIKMGKTVEDAFGSGIQDALDEAGVSAEEFADALKQANKPAGTLKKELLALKEAMARMKVEGKDTGKEFEALRSRAGKLQDAIADANAEIKNAGSDTRNIDNVVGSISALAGGFAAAQGAAALFVEENEDLQRTLVKVTGAMAVAQGLQQLLNATQKEGALIKLKDSIATGAQSAAQAIYSAAVGTSTGALKAFRIALLATGIGAIIALLVLAADAMGLFGSKTKTAADRANDLAEGLNNINRELDESVLKLNRNGQLQIEFLKQRLASEKQIHEQSIANIQAENDALRRGIAERLKLIGYENEVQTKAQADFLIALKKRLLEGENVSKNQRAILEQEVAALQEVSDAFKRISDNDFEILKSNEQFKTKVIVDENNKRLEAIKKAQEKLKQEREKAIAEEKKEAADAIARLLKRFADEEEQLRIHFENEQEIRERDRAKRQADEDAWEKLRLERIESFRRTGEDAAKAAEDAEDALQAKRIKNARNLIAVAQQVADFYQHLSDLASEQERQKIQEQRDQIDALEKAGAISKRDADLRRQQTEIAEKRAKQNQAKREKDAAVFRALIAIPQAFLQGLSQGGIYLAAVYAALAAAEAALVIARPIPKFAKGKKDGYEGPGIVGDQGTELVERNGRMFLYTKPTQTYLGAKDKVYTATETKNILHNSNISTTIQQPKTERFDYARLGRAIAKDNVNINIDKDFISEAVNNGLMKNNYYRNRYQFKKS